MKESKLRLGDNIPYALETVFSFVVIGKTSVLQPNKTEPTSNLKTLVCMLEVPLNTLMRHIFGFLNNHRTNFN